MYTYPRGLQGVGYRLPNCSRYTPPEIATHGPGGAPWSPPWMLTAAAVRRPGCAGHAAPACTAPSGPPINCIKRLIQLHIISAPDILHSDITCTTIIRITPYHITQYNIPRNTIAHITRLAPLRAVVLPSWCRCPLSRCCPWRARPGSVALVTTVTPLLHTLMIDIRN